MRSRSEIKVGAVISYLTIVINIILGLVYTPWTLKIIGSSDYGLYTLTTSLIAIFLLDFGMSAAVGRYISNYRALGRQDDIDSFVGLSVKFYAILCSVLAVILVVVFFMLDRLYVGLTPEELLKLRYVFLINAFFIVVSFPVNICNGILTAYEKFIWQKSADIINKIGTVIITVAVLLMGGGLYSLVFINGLLNFVTFIAKVVIIRKVTPVKISFRKGNTSLRDVFSFSAWTTVNSVSQQITNNLAPSILGMTSNTLSITIYGFARTIEGYVYNITEAINGLFMPSVSRLIAKEDDASRVLPLMIKVGRLNHSVITLLLMGFLIMGQKFVELWVGAEYSVLYPCILFLIFPYYLTASEQIANTSVIVHNKVKYTSLINIIVSCICLVISYYVSLEYGVVGMCAVICIGSCIKSILVNIVYWKVLKIDIFSFFRQCHLSFLPGTAGSVLVSYFLIRTLDVQINLPLNWITFFAECIVIGAVFFLCMWLFTWNDYEKSLIRSGARKFTHHSIKA